jgi:hypothetical protein
MKPSMIVPTLQRLADAIEKGRRAGMPTGEQERQLVHLFREHHEALAPVLPAERYLLLTFPGCWEHVKLLADENLHYVLESIKEFYTEGWEGTEIPPEFFLMRNLETVSFSGCDLESLAGNYAALPRLQELVAEEVWTLKFLDEPSVARAPAIERVVISACDLQVFPTALYDVPTLTHLVISYCNDGYFLTRPFTELPPGISRLRSLQELDLAGIGLLSLPDELYSMTWLRQLNLLTTHLSGHILERLQEALPTTKLLFDEPSDDRDD